MPATLWGSFIGKRLALLAIFLILFTSCYKDHLYVQLEKIDRDFLASSHVGTPDPRQIDPPEGKRLLVSWRFPTVLVERGLTLHLTVRFWDETQQEICKPIQKSRDYLAFNFCDKRLLTYKIEVKDVDGKCVQLWEHQFWTELIAIDKSKS